MQGSGVIGNSAEGPQEIEGEPGLSLTLAYLPGVSCQQLLTNGCDKSFLMFCFLLETSANFGNRGSKCKPAQRPATAPCPLSQIGGGSIQVVSAWCYVKPCMSSSPHCTPCMVPEDSPHMASFYIARRAGTAATWACPTACHSLCCHAWPCRPAQCCLHSNFLETETHYVRHSSH